MQIYIYIYKRAHSLSLMRVIVIYIYVQKTFLLQDILIDLKNRYIFFTLGVHFLIPNTENSLEQNNVILDF